TSSLAQVSEFLFPVTRILLHGSLIHKVRQLFSAVDSMWYIGDNISLRCSFIERRLMCLEFSPWETQRQIAAAIQEWDMNQDPLYGARQAFQHLGRYSRNFLQRTLQAPSALQLSTSANKAIQESGEDAAGPKITALTQGLRQHWAVQFHGQGDGHEPTATVASHIGQLTQHELVDFYGFH
ncbi:unnamed protein product, partial [Prorocentrum cordatum]